MKKLSFFIPALLLMIFSMNVIDSQAQDRQGGNFGLGVMAGSPTGVSAKVWMGPSNALHAGAAWSTYTYSGTNFHLHLDYTRYNYEFLTAQRGSLAAYYGIGGRVLFRDSNRDDRFGVRIPLGINYEFEENPLEVFVEIAPIVDLAPATDLSADSVVGIRYFF